MKKTDSKSEKVAFDPIQHVVMALNLKAATNVTFLHMYVDNDIPKGTFSPAFIQYFNYVLKENSGLYIENGKLIIPPKFTKSYDRLQYLSMCSAIFLRQVYHMCMYVEYHRDNLSDLKPYEKAFLQLFLSQFALTFETKDSKLLITKVEQNG